jgi:hypothetical protein
VLRYSWGLDAEDTAVLSLCDVHEAPIDSGAKEPGPDLMRLSPSLDRVEGPHPLRTTLGMDNEPFWTNIGVPPHTRKWFKTSRRRRRSPEASAEETGP